MENVKIISDNGTEIIVNGIFYIFNSKYYFIYTTCEVDENEYVKLYVVQVCKEIKNTPTGPIDTGYMLGMEISNPDEWINVQDSITKIVEDKKSGTKSGKIQYLPMNMLVNLKIVSKNKFKLMKHIVEDNFNVIIDSKNIENTIDNIFPSGTNVLEKNNEISPIQPVEPIINNNSIPLTNILSTDNENIINNESNLGEVIIDYRARFFEEQEKNKTLEEEIKILNQKLDNIKSIIG